MNVFSTEIADVKVIEPSLFKDARGYFFESFQAREFCEKVQIVEFLQDNEARSARGTLRGLHFQAPPHAQAKLVRVVRGSVLDVAVDLRKGSPTFAKYVAIELSERNHRQLFVPRGFAHGYLALEDDTIFQYKVDNYYHAASDRGIRFDDPLVAVDWGTEGIDLLLSEKDKRLPVLSTIDSGFYYQKS